MDKITAKQPDFSGQRILIVGDLILDKYIFGGVTRISPEAPVPVVQLQDEKIALGGAANVAYNVVNAGGKAKLVGLTGADEMGNVLHKLLTEKNIDNLLYPFLPYSITKTRVIADHQQVVRIDAEPTDFSLAPEKEAEIVSQIENLVSDFNCLIISANKII